MLHAHRFFLLVVTIIIEFKQGVKKSLLLTCIHYFFLQRDTASEGTQRSSAYSTCPSRPCATRSTWTICLSKETSPCWTLCWLRFPHSGTNEAIKYTAFHILLRWKKQMAEKCNLHDRFPYLKSLNRRVRVLYLFYRYLK